MSSSDNLRQPRHHPPELLIPKVLVLTGLDLGISSIREQYERQLKDLPEAYGQAILELRARKIAVPAGQVKTMIEFIRPGPKDEGFVVQ